MASRPGMLIYGLLELPLEEEPLLLGLLLPSEPLLGDMLLPPGDSAPPVAEPALRP